MPTPPPPPNHPLRGEDRAIDPIGPLARVALDEVPDYIAILDTSGHILALNRNAEAAAGASQSAFVGATLWSCPPFDLSSEAAERIQRCCQRAVHGEPARVEIDLDRHDDRDHHHRDQGHGAHSPHRVPTKFTIKLRRAVGAPSDCLIVRGRDVSMQVLSDQLIEDLRRERDALRQRLRDLQPATIDAALPPSPPLGRPRVLVVEDNPEMNRFLTEALSRSFEVDSALDGAAGLARAIECPPDLILTDLVMPRLMGDALVRAVRTHHVLDEVPILLLTARSDDELRLQLLREGAQDYLTKPFSAKELLIRVGNLVDVKRTRQVLREEVATQGRSLESLARALTVRSRELQGALEATRVARESAEQAGDAKNLFLSVASHELRTPLAALQLRIDRLRRGLGNAGGRDHDDTFRGVQRAIDRLTALVESLLEYSKVQSNVVPVSPQIFDARSVIGEIVEERRENAQDKSVELRYEWPAHLIRIQTDPALFRTVVANLVDNALKFTDRGHVEVRLEQRRSSVRVSVHDTGPGIPIEDRARIFEPFAHVEAADNKHTPGVGLGLALVREVMTALHGSVELSSEVGTGSTFTVILSAPAGAEAAVKAETRTATPLSVAPSIAPTAPQIAAPTVAAIPAPNGSGRKPI
jgi:signal transduction histidine kinase